MSLGTNLGDKEKNLRDAVHKIEEQIGKVISLSAFYMTAPWGFESDNSFSECSRMHRNGVAASGSAAEDAGDRA